MAGRRLAGSLALFGLSACAVATSPSDETCATDRECAAGEACVAGRCQPGAGSPSAGPDAGASAPAAPDLATSAIGPSPVWSSSGGGSLSDNATQINFTVGGAPFAGESRGDDGRYIEFGHLFSDTF